MRLRTFNAPNTKKALALVKAELGPNAVILNIEQVGQSTKVIAALDREAILAQPIATAKNPLDLISQALDFHQVPRMLAERITRQAEHVLLENPHQALAAVLRLRFPMHPLSDKHPNRPIMLVGLPGAGKTATLAKLMTRAKLRKWESVAITCDLLKAGALEQLETYAKALEISAFNASNAINLKHALSQTPANAFVVIDTVGCNPLDAADINYLTDLANAVKAEMILVMAAGGCPVECAELAQLFAEAGASRLIPTRIDATRRYGGILAAADAGRLALAEFGTSPKIANGLDIIGTDQLAEWLLQTEGNNRSQRTTQRQAFGIRR